MSWGRIREGTLPFLMHRKFLRNPLCIKKLATLERCAARGKETTALQSARARRLHFVQSFLLEGCLRWGKLWFVCGGCQRVWEFLKILAVLEYVWCVADG